MTEPGRTRHDDSIEASNPSDTDLHEGDFVYTGYDSNAGTRIGDESEGGEKADRLRELNQHPDPQEKSLSNSQDRLSIQQSKQDKIRMAQSICSKLPISELQKENIVRAIQIVDFDRFGHQRGIETVCLALAAIIVNGEREGTSNSLSEVTALEWEEEFTDLKDSLGISMSDHSTAKQIARKEIDGEYYGPVNAGIRRDSTLPNRAKVRCKEYWETAPPAVLASEARRWMSVDNERKKSIPDEQRRIIDLLRRWKPWNIGDDQLSDDDIDEEQVQKEAEELLEAMEDDE